MRNEFLFCKQANETTMSKDFQHNKHQFETYIEPICFLCQNWLIEYLH
jgi:hypothetical protein